MKKIKVLVVEDEIIVAKDIVSQLSSMGCGFTRTASSVDEAIKKVLKFNPDLVLMDIVLNGRTDGISAAEQINKLGIPVIYLTSFADADTLSRAKDTNPYGYIVKPFKEDDLRTAVELAVSRKKKEKLREEKELLLNSVLLCTCRSLIITDSDMKVIFMNYSAEEFTGWKMKDALNRKITEVFSISNIKNHYTINDILSNITNKEAVINISKDLSLLMKDGTRKCIQTTISSIMPHNGGNKGFVIELHPCGAEPKISGPLSKTLNSTYTKLFERSNDPRVAAVLKALGFIERNLGKQLNLEQIARSSNMSKYHFARIFKNIQGISPMSFVNTVKIESAARMLKESSLSISEAAYSVGFNSLSHFTEQFNKLMGLTPSVFRSRHRKSKDLK